ncbi:substrate-binding domain-containing protein [Polynucleobacter sp. AP-Feld-500C-C5]|uniref:substrate-binding domain-containing protein n=1 Tax=Polynucleobacter sp. AP-Feld-500C-C5 TaxID=2576924 RepID=UPI001C0C86A7|nr:substrate-binding domain-containing protein [Polynucleobacter sp. AP-Feld-500C-C5]MBU3632520.1 substrate-binding domain-containing protein [Polynucleobacter sp. AP-Feld-500C-C5]
MKLLLVCALSFLLSTPAMAQLEVLISGGFQGPYSQMLPSFEKMTGITVITKSGASQGSGPKTIKAQLATGVTADVVILSREGLAELIAENKIVPNSDVDLAQAPLGLAVPTGNAKPDISSAKAFADALVKAKKIVVPGSTSGIYLNKELFPKLGISEQISVKITERGSQATAALAAREANIAVQPSSELVNISGIDYVDPLPNSIQLIQTFAAARVMNSPNSEAAKKLIEYLSSPNAAESIKNGGMNLVR